MLGLRVCEVLCAPFKSGVCVSYSPLTVLYLSPVPFKATCFEGVIFQHRTARLGRTSAIVIVFLFVGCLPGSVGLGYTVSASPTHDGSFFISLVEQIFFCLSPGLFSLIVAL